MWSIFRALKRSWAQHFISQISALMILVLTYSAVLFIALALTNIQQLFSLWGQVSQVTVYLKKDSGKPEREGLKKYITGSELVQSTELVSSEQSAEKFRKRFKGISSQKIDPGKISQFFPEFFELSLVQAKAYGNDSLVLEDFAMALKQKFPIVANVSYGKSWLKQYVSILYAVETVAWLLIGSFLLGSLVVSSNVIKTILFHRKDEIEILEFIGADDKTIYLPQVVNVVVTASVALLVALSINYGLYSFFVNSESLSVGTSTRSQLSFLSIYFVVGLVSVCLLGLICDSVFTIYRMMPRQSRAFKRNII